MCKRAKIVTVCNLISVNIKHFTYFFGFCHFVFKLKCIKEMTDKRYMQMDVVFVFVKPLKRFGNFPHLSI